MAASTSEQVGPAASSALTSRPRQRRRSHVAARPPLLRTRQPPPSCSYALPCPLCTRKSTRSRSRKRKDGSRGTRMGGIGQGLEGGIAALWTSLSRKSVRHEERPRKREHGNAMKARAALDGGAGLGLAGYPTHATPWTAGDLAHSRPQPSTSASRSPALPALWLVDIPRLRRDWVSGCWP